MRGYHNAVKILNAGEKKLVAPCGLYCGTCIDYLVYKNCHGCGCECGKCAFSRHHKQCDIYECCLEQKGLSACSECQELLVQGLYDSAITLFGCIICQS
jgi:hypothetical protein